MIWAKKWNKTKGEKTPSINLSSINVRLFLTSDQHDRLHEFIAVLAANKLEKRRLKVSLTFVEF